MTDWFVVQTTSGEETRARDNLTMQDFDCYLPMLYKKTTPVAFFPGYLFLRAEGRWNGVNGTRGVIRLLTNGDAPAVLKSRFVEELQRREVDGLLRWKEVKQALDTDTVRTVAGRFRISGSRDRVNLLLRHVQYPHIV